MTDPIGVAVHAPPEYTQTVEQSIDMSAPARTGLMVVGLAPGTGAATTLDNAAAVDVASNLPPVRGNEETEDPRGW